MPKIIRLQQAYRLVNGYHQKDKSIILVGGCFDILHIGHIHFLEKAKEKGDILIVLLESDEKVTLLKGKNRPLHNQKDRGKILSSLVFVDLVILLPYIRKDKDYADIVCQIKPEIIAVSKNDPLVDKKRKQARSVSGLIKEIPYRNTASTSKLARLLGID